MSSRSCCFLVVLLLGFVPACGSKEGSSSTQTQPEAREAASQTRESGGGIWNMLAEERSRKAERAERNRARQDSLAAGAASGRARFTPEQLSQMDAWWRQFLSADVAWLDSRYAWRKLGPEAREVLVESLIVAMVRGFESNGGPLYQRARAELIEMGDDSAPLFAAALGQRLGDDVLRRHCVEMLGLIGRKGLPPIRREYAAARGKARADLLAAAAAMGRDGAPETTAFFCQVIDDSDDFTSRLRAIEGLGKSRDPDGIPRLIRCLGESDASIRKFAAAGLGGQSDARAVAALIGALEAAERKARGDGQEAEVAHNCRRSLWASTGQRWDTAEQWRRWWSRR